MDAKRYAPLEGTKKEMKEQYRKQLADFSKTAQAGKVICLTDLLSNAERLGKMRD